MSRGRAHSHCVSLALMEDITKWKTNSHSHSLYYVRVCLVHERIHVKHTGSHVMLHTSVCMRLSHLFTLIVDFYTEEDYTLRTPAQYDFYCSLLNGPLATFDSTTYGVNSRSPLNQIDNFYVANGQLPQDIMHVIFEGVMPLNVRLMLCRFVYEEGLFLLTPE